MRRAFGFLAVPVIAAAALCACSLLVDSAGLSGGVEPSSDGSPADTGGSVDGPTSGDAPTDGTSAADAGADATPACVDSATRFCDDFDQATPGAKWTDTSMRRGQVAYNAGSLSPPNALHATISSGGGYGEAALTKVFASVPSKVRCELDVKLDVIPASGELDIFDVTTTGAGAGHNIYIAVFDGKWSVDEYQDAPDGGVLLDRQTVLAGGLPMGTWFHVVFDTSQTDATLTANGTSATLSSLTVPAGTARSVSAGITYASSGVQTGSVFIDNVDCTTQP